MNNQYIFTSLTRISDLQEKKFTISPVNQKNWKTGDYVAGKVTYDAQGWLKAELYNGRMLSLMKGNILIGALGERYATLEVTGSWKKIESDGKMHMLTGAGLFGKATSARIVTHLLKEEGLKVVGAKLTGAGRYKDILAIKDAGANYVFDFVDVGLPSSIYPKDKFIEPLEKLLSLIQ